MELNFNSLSSVERDLILAQQAKGLREPLDGYWKQLYKFARPDKDDVCAPRSTGERLASSVYDDTAIEAISVSSAGMHGYLTNPAQHWFTLESSDRKLKDNREVKLYLKEVEEELYATFSHSNLDTELPEVYSDLLIIGCADLYEEEDFKDTVRFKTNYMSEIYFLPNERGEIDKVFRYFSFSTLEAIEKFKDDNMPKDIVDAFKDKKYQQRFEFLLSCTPRDIYDPNKIDNLNMPYSSRWIYIKGKTLVRERGYQVFPHFCPRFYSAKTHPYGYSPLMFCNPSVQMMQGGERSMILGTELSIQPMLIMPHKNFLKPFRYGPKAINYDMSTDPAFAGRTVQSFSPAGNLPMGHEYLEAKRRRIRSMLFAELFLFIASAEGSPQKTATEINARINEGMLLLGTVVGRLKRELLTPKIERTYTILAEANRLPPLPDVLIGKSFLPRFTSPLAKVQTAVEQNETINFVQLIGELKNFFPEAGDLLNVDNAIRRIHELKTISPEVINPEKEVEFLRQLRSEQIQAQAQQEQAAMQMQNLKTGAEAQAIATKKR